MVQGRFFDAETAVAHDVTVRLTGGTLIIDGAISRVWAVSMVVAAKEPDPDGRVTLSIPGSPARLEIADRALLGALSTSGARMPAAIVWSGRHWVIAAAVGVACVALAVVALNELPRWLAPLIPVSWETQLARPIEALLETDKHVCAGAAGQRALDRLTERLRVAGGITRPVKLTVLDDALVNAFTLPGGHVVIMRGLIDDAEDGPELAGVIAHELGHVAHFDPTAMLLRQIGIGVLATSIGLGDSNSVGAGLSRDLLTRSYGREAETAADAAGIATLGKAELRADGLARFFARLETHEGGGTGENGWLSTHPPTEQRRQRAVRPTEGNEPFSDAEWKAIRSMCGTRPRSKER
jgi:Zn-dependent protease with chaperone function